MGGLLDAVRAYGGGDTSRFHMPGHKGAPLPYPGFDGIASLDLTEIAGLDSLYTASGVIRDTERAYASLYCSHDCFLSAGGSTLCIQAMLALAVRPGGRLLISRGAHVAAVNAMALLDLHPQWLLPGTDPQSGLPSAVTAQQVSEALSAGAEISAVYVTSPSFFGTVCDIAAIAQVCKAHGVPLLVDNAHGAHLHFFGKHPIALGADVCCDSLHKTLPVLTGGAVLHLADARYAAHAREKLSLFGSTSPSYLIMSSIDGALGWLGSAGAAQQISQTAATLAKIAQVANARGYPAPADMGDPLRLTLCGGQPGGHLRSHKIEPEYAGDGCAVLMAGPFNTGQDLARLQAAVETLPRREPLAMGADAPVLPEQALSVREAVFAPRELVPLGQAVGRVSGALVSPCPPGIALVCAGERIDAQTVRSLKKYGISHVSVVQ